MMTRLVLQWPWRNLALWVSLLLAATMFALPISSSGKSILFTMSLCGVVLEPHLRARLYDAFNSSWGRATLLLVFFIMISAFHGPASCQEKWMVLSKYLKLLYLPIVAVGFANQRTRMLAIHAYLMAMLLTCVLSFAKYFGLLTFQNLDPGDVFRNHIMTGYMMAFAAFLVFWLATKATWRGRFAYVFLGGLFSFQVLFVNTGRTGYVIYACLMGLLILQILPWRKALLGLVLLFVALIAVYELSPTLRHQVTSIFTDITKYESQQKNTSVGYRIQFHHLAKQLWSRHLFFGNGAGSFTASFRIENPIPSWAGRLLEPHSLYWLFAVEFGFVGLALLGAFFVTLIKESLKLRTLSPVAIALILPYIIGNLTDSLLFYSGSGYFFILFMGLCLGENISRRAPASSYADK